MNTHPFATSPHPVVPSASSAKSYTAQKGSTVLYHAGGQLYCSSLGRHVYRRVHVESNHKDKPAAQAVDIRKDVLSDKLSCNSVTAIVKEYLK